MSFERKLKTGQVAEGLIAKWLTAQGCSLLPAYETDTQTSKGPRLFTPEGDLVAPDMLVFAHNNLCWVESKHKSVFTWHRNTQRWTTGIDLKHYRDYLRVAETTKLPVWLLFYHRESQPDQRDVVSGCPEHCPTGLYGGELSRLFTVENHRSLPFNAGRAEYIGHGRSGMVYWSNEALQLMATKEEIDAFLNIQAAA